MAFDFSIEMANYNHLTDKQKDTFFMNLMNTRYKDVSEENKQTVSELSTCVELYLNAPTYTDKNKYWEHFDDLAKRYSDPIKFRREKSLLK